MDLAFLIEMSCLTVGLVFGPELKLCDKGRENRSPEQLSDARKLADTYHRLEHHYETCG